jgi:hypothetical protein
VCGLPVRVEHVPLIGTAIALCFYSAFLLFVGRLTFAQGAFCAVLAVSPAVMLGVERGNIDLIIFALIVAAVSARGCLPYALMFACACLKLYPICALAAALRDRCRRAVVGSLAIVILFAGYLLLIRRDLALISAATPRSYFRSFGCSVLFRRYDLHIAGLNPRGTSALLVGVVGLAVILIVPKFLMMRADPKPHQRHW